MENFDRHDANEKRANVLTLVVDFENDDDQLNERDFENYHGTMEDFVHMNESKEFPIDIVDVVVH